MLSLTSGSPFGPLPLGAARHAVCDGVQSSTRYPGGLALRFARVKRYRPDKDAAEADTIDDLRALRPAAGHRT